MSAYDKCPSCNNKQKGAEVYRCKECGKIFCSKCGESKFGDVCPKCDVASRPVGKIA